MDQKQLQQKIAEYYVKLPEDLKVFFAGMSWIASIQDISLKYTLNTEQIETLTTETTLLLLCITSTADYVKTIEAELKLPAEAFEKVLNEIGESILKDTYQKLDEGFLNNLETLDKENKVEMQDVPLPPYKKPEAPKVEPIKTDIIDNKKIEETKSEAVEQTLVSQAKKDVSFLAQKLNNPTITNTVVSDHSLPNINQQDKKENPLAKSHDPYREGIEI